MKELSLNILDIAENSVKAGARSVTISIAEQGGSLTLTITDDGKGMDKETLEKVTNPFYTTRTTRPVGMGLPLLKLAAEQTGGEMSIESVSREDSPDNHGTRVMAVFNSRHIDCVPLGDVTASIITLIQGSPEIDFVYTHSVDGREVRLDTRELRQVLGYLPLNSFEVLQWIKGYLEEQYAEINI